MQHIQRAMMLTEAPNTNTQNMPLELLQVQKFILYIYMGACVVGGEKLLLCCWSGKSFLLLWVKSREFVCVAPRERVEAGGGARSPTKNKEKRHAASAFKGRLVQLCGIHNAVVLTRGTH
jgi:hypothetical protein